MGKRLGSFQTQRDPVPGTEQVDKREVTGRTEDSESSTSYL